MITVGNLQGLEVDFKIYGLRDDETAKIKLLLRRKMKIKEDTKDVKYCCKADFIAIHKPHFYMSHKINRHSFKEICKKIILVVAMAQT